MTTIHLGDHDTDCETCKANCDCQDCRIRENMKDNLAYALETGDLQMFEDIFEDADPFDYL
jgi:hypothetical protein